MYMLIKVCNHPGVLRLLYFGLIFLDIITVFIPIGLILMLLIDFTKAVASNSADEQIKSTKLVVKRIVYAIVIFAVPWIVDLFMGILGSAGVNIGTDYHVCLKNASSGYFAKYDKLLKAEEEVTKKNPASPESKYETAATYLTGIAWDERCGGDKNPLKPEEPFECERYGGEKYSGDPDVPWCGYFVRWCMNNVTIESGKTLWDYFIDDLEDAGADFVYKEKFNYGGNVGDYIIAAENNNHLKFYKSQYYSGKYQAYIPKEGDLIIYWYPDNNGGKYWNGTMEEAIYADHIGIVLANDIPADGCGNGTVHVIEGNTGGGGSNAARTVHPKCYNRGDHRILGYISWYE